LASAKAWQSGKKKTRKKKMNKTNKELNTEHDRKEILRVCPKEQRYDFKPLEEAIKGWFTK
jgi:hypothetical protein